MGMTAWSDKHIDIMRRMVAEGRSSTEIGKAVGRKPTTVRAYIKRNRAILNLTVANIQGRTAYDMPRYDATKFEKEWSGAVPYLHWSITKPWKSNAQD